MPKGKIKKKDTRVLLQVEKVCDGTFAVWMPSFGSVGCSIEAKDIYEARGKLGEYIFNELAGRNLE